MSDEEKAWHFVGGTLRDGRPVPEDGEWLVHDGPIEMCASGLHASTNLRDALVYAPGNILCRVECRGDIEHGDDKLVCRERKILWRIDAEKLLYEAARKFALEVAHLWKMPEVVREFLEAGDDELRAAAKAAAWAAAGAATSDAARAAAGAAARGAASDAASDAARAAAGAAASDAAGGAARAAARGAASAAARARQEEILLALVEEYRNMEAGDE